MQRRMLNRVARGPAPGPSGSAAAAPPPPPLAATAGMPVVAPVTATPSAAAGVQLVELPAYLKGGAALNGVLPSLLEGSIPDAVGNLFIFWGFEPQLKKLREMLDKINLVYRDGEGKMYTRAGRGVADWIDGVREAAYEMNDIIDDMNAEVLRLQVEFQRNNLFEYEIELKLGEVMQKLNELETKARRDYKLQPAGDDGWVSDYRQSHKTTPSVDASAVYGRGEDADRLVKSLLEPYVSSDKRNYSVVGIWGSGGMGKTTVAKLIFEDKRVVEKFDLRSWACVSDGPFNARKVLKDLCTNVEKNKKEKKEKEKLEKIGELVMGKKFLFVLDDVWTDKDKDWEDLKSPFKSCEVGSIFLVTTRNKGVLGMMHSRVTHTLGPLADAHCWELFSEKAFTHKNRNEDLEQIGLDIVKKCKGIPLSAKVLGRTLHNQVDKRKWENVLESNYWDLPGEEDEDLPALRISYYYLPFHLKLCFEYLSLFPSDYEFDKRVLVQLWIGSGFVRSEGGRYLEDIGNEYYEELQERSLIEADNKMHDLAHSLACKLSKKFNSRFMNGSEVDMPVVTSARHVLFYGRAALLSPLAVRELHTCIHLVDYNYSLDVSILCEIRRMKFLHVLDLHDIAMENMSDDLFSELRHLSYLRLGHRSIKKLPLSIYRLRSLQTLILCGCRLEGLSEEVVNLVSLLHLDLSATHVSSLISLCNLPRLQTLILFNCGRLEEVPTEIGKLQTLRKLDLWAINTWLLPDSLCNLANLEEFYFTKSGMLPKFIRRLTQLKIMPDYKVGTEEGRGIGELQNLRNLKSLSLDCLENVKSVKEAKMAALENKKSLTFLSFIWSEGTSTNEEEDNEDRGESDFEVLEALQPHPTKIESLYFESYKGKEFPSWMRGSHFVSLKSLKMAGMKRLTTVAHATFKFLKELTISNCPCLEEVLIATPMLEDLSVDSCSKLRCLSLDLCDGALMESPKGLEVNNCANLRSLRVGGCHQLESMGNKGLPKSLEKIEVNNCSNLTSLLSSMHNPASLALLELRINSCPGLESFGEQGLPHSIQTLILEDCESLKSLPLSMQSLDSLSFLRIVGCPQLESFPDHGLPHSIQALILKDCESLKSLPLSMQSLDSLRNFRIISCRQICLAQDWLPRSLCLSSLEVVDCPGLKSFPSYMDQLESLRFLCIEGCHQLESFPHHGLPHSIRWLIIRNCQNLRSLPSGLPIDKDMLMLTIEDCPKLETANQDRGGSASQV